MNKYREKSETLLTEDFSSYQGLISSSGLPLAIVSPEGSFLQELIPVPAYVYAVRRAFRQSAWKTCRAQNVCAGSTAASTA